VLGEARFYYGWVAGVRAVSLTRMITPTDKPIEAALNKVVKEKQKFERLFVARRRPS